GQTFLPGIAVLGRQHAAEARPYLERADAIRGRRFTYLGRTLGFPGRIDWNPAGLSEAWRVALNSLDDLVPLGVAAALGRGAASGGRWYAVAVALVRGGTAGTERERGVGWSLPALARRIPNLLYLNALFGAELRAEPAQRRGLLESLYAQTAALAAALQGHRRDHHVVHAGRALFMAGRLFHRQEGRGGAEAGGGGGSGPAPGAGRAG